MKKEKELIKELMELQAFAARKGFIINSIDLEGFWYSDLESKSPRRILSIDIEAYRDQVEGYRISPL